MNYTTNETNTTTDLANVNKLKKPEYLKIALYCVAIVLSLIGNSLVIAVVYKNANQRMKTPNNYFVVSMAVGDGLISIINMAARVIFLAYGSSLPLGGVAGLIGCKIQTFMWVFVISLSTGSLSAIAVDRFLLVFFPLKRIITLQRACVVIIVIIIIGAAYSWPLLIFSTTIERDGLTICHINMSSFEGFRNYFLLLFVAFVFCPLFISLVLYSAISLKLWMRKSPGNQENSTRMNRRIVVMLITVVLLFLFCWMPVSTLTFACLAYPSKNICKVKKGDIDFTIWFLAFSNSAINPYVYFIFNKNFRHGARVIWSSIRGCCPGFFFKRPNHVRDVVEMNPTVIQSQAS